MEAFSHLEDLARYEKRLAERHTEAQHEIALRLQAEERPRCSRCQARMMLERVSPGPAGFERRLFECPRCDHVETSLIALDPFSPMRPVGPPANSGRQG